MYLAIPKNCFAVEVDKKNRKYLSLKTFPVYFISFGLKDIGLKRSLQAFHLLIHLGIY